jgi:hypothetical protein
MYKLIAGVLMLASLVFGGEIKIDLNTPGGVWDHYKAALIRVDLDSYIGAGEIIQSAILQFTGVQNYKEPENNDILYYDLLKLNSEGTGQQDIKFYTDNQDASNYFRAVSNPEYAWVNGKSALGSYTDDNDNNLKINYDLKIANWENTHPGYDWRWEQGVNWVNQGKWWKDPNGGWHQNYDGRHGVVWSQITNYQTEDFNVALNAADVNAFKESNGWIGIGLDADCHYAGNLSLIVTTQEQNVPEPGSIALILLGLASLTGAFAMKRKKK